MSGKAKSVIVILLVCGVVVSACTKEKGTATADSAVTRVAAPPVSTIVPQPVSTTVPQIVKDIPRVAVISAFGAELELLLAQAKISEKHVIGGTTYHVGTLAGNDVVMFLSGVSIVNAGVNTQIAIDYFNIERIVFSGIAGGVNPSLHIGDVTVPKQWGLYQKALFAREMPDGSFETGWHDAPFGNYGMIFPQNVSVVKVSGMPDESESVFWFEADGKMLAVARAVAKSVDLAQCTVDDVCLDFDPIIKVDGNGTSGPTFVDNAKYRNWVWDTFQADALDMETASVALVAYKWDIPYIAFRSLSDLAGGGQGENQIGTFFQIAADNSAKYVLAFLEAWAGGGIPEAIEQPYVIGSFLVGPENDRGWSQAHREALDYVAQKLDVRYVYIDKVNPADRPETTVEQVVDDLIEQGAQIIFATSDDFKDETRLAAEKHPDVFFVHISGDDVWTGKNPANLANLMGRMEYGKAIAGCAAALTTKTGIIGYVGPLINEETRRLASSAYLGARYCYEGDAELQFLVTWIGFWFAIPGVTLDPTEVANDFFNSGADVVLSGIDTTEALIVAKQRHDQGEQVWAVAYDYVGGCEEAPDVCLGVPYFNWGPGYLDAVKAAKDGTWKSTFSWDGPDWADINNPDTSAIGFVFGDGISESAKDGVAKYIDGLASGNVELFQGPLNYQDGSPFVLDGAVASDEQVWYMKQLLAGMEGASQ